MPRANRYYVPGLVWHITHRCHKCEFLLKFAKDRKRWQYWLFEGRKRFGLKILNYSVTSNHIHLLVEDGNQPDTISKSLQLIAGRTGQEYNQRKDRGGAFWEDRYHATAVESGKHLRRCMAYIDMNMVRAGAVKHPCLWEDGGYGAIQNPPRRYRLIDVKQTALRLGYSGADELQREQRRWIAEALESEEFSHRDPKWSESLAVGSQAYVSQVAEKLEMKSCCRKEYEQDGVLVLREPKSSYNAVFKPKKAILSAYFDC